MNILQLTEMVEMLEEFIQTPTDRIFHIGGITGTQVFKYVIESILVYNNYQDICIIEGCQDYIGLTKHSRCNNHLYYMDLIKETVIPNPKYGGGFEGGYIIWNPLTLDYRHEVDISYVGTFNYVIINDAQLIPKDILDAIIRMYPGKLVVIFDPFESGAERFIGYPCVVDCLSKVSAITAFARNIFNVPSRAIDKTVKCSVKESKIYKRSIGRADGCQYITNIDDLATEVWNKQRSVSFRKNQRLWVVDDRIHRFKSHDGEIYTITKNSLLVIEMVPTTTKKLKLRLWSSKFVFESEVSYSDKPIIGSIMVRPANIIMFDEVRYHKYPNTVMIQGKNLSPREGYNLLKNTNNLVVGT